MLKRALMGAALCFVCSTHVQAQQADLRLTMFVPSTIHAGQQFTITLLVDNIGPDQSVQPEVNLEAVTSVGQFAEANGCSLSIRTEGGLVDEFDCNFAKSTGWFQLAEYGSNWLNRQSGSDEGKMIGTIDLIVYDPGEIVFRSWVASDTLDPNPSNDVAISRVDVLPAAADLSVDLSSQATTGSEALMINYEAVARNVGPSNADDATLVITLPGNPRTAARHLTVVSMSPGCTYDPAANTVSCDLPSLSLPFNGERTVEVSIEWTGRPVKLDSTAVVSDAVVPDPRPENNTDSDTVNPIGNGGVFN